jgi:calcineurin-like phosphoesterase
MKTALCCVLNLSDGTLCMRFDCIFITAENQVAELREKTKVIIVDMHAEATSEKKALGWFLDGEVSAVLGPIRMCRPLTRKFCRTERLISVTRA